MKKIFILIIILHPVISFAGTRITPQALRVWTYQNFSLSFTRYISWSVIPGFRGELCRSERAVSDIYFIELFTGPVFSSAEMRTGPLRTKISIPCWYYYNGYPLKNNRAHLSTHNIAIAPMMINKIGDWMIMNRFFFHNTIFADIYSRLMDYPEKRQRGFSCLLAWKFELTWFFIKPWGINIANELYSGIAENKKVPPITGPGFSEKGIQFNRTYAGFSYTYRDNGGNSVIINPQYILELNYVGEGVHLRGIYHYFYLVMSYTFKLWRDESPQKVDDK